MAILSVFFSIFDRSGVRSGERGRGGWVCSYMEQNMRGKVDVEKRGGAKFKMMKNAFTYFAQRGA